MDRDGYGDHNKRDPSPTFDVGFNQDRALSSQRVMRPAKSHSLLRVTKNGLPLSEENRGISRPRIGAYQTDRGETGYSLGEQGRSAARHDRADDRREHQDSYAPGQIYNYNNNFNNLAGIDNPNLKHLIDREVHLAEEKARESILKNWKFKTVERINNINEQMTELTAECEALEHERDQLNDNYMHGLEQLFEKEGEIMIWSIRSEQCQDQLQKTAEAVNRMKQDLTDKIAEVEILEKEKDSKLDNLNQQLRDKQAHLTSCLESVAKVKIRVEEKESELKAIEEFLYQRAPYEKDLRKKLETLEKNLKFTEDEYKKVMLNEFKQEERIMGYKVKIEYIKGKLS